MHRIIAAGNKRLDLFQRGKVYSPKIAHDEWCKFNNGKECNCYPDITIETPIGAFSIDHDGECHSINNK